jgi:hypothetical protein
MAWPVQAALDDEGNSPHLHKRHIIDVLSIYDVSCVPCVQQRLGTTSVTGIGASRVRVTGGTHMFLGS